MNETTKAAIRALRAHNDQSNAYISNLSKTFHQMFSALVADGYAVAVEPSDRNNYMLGPILKGHPLLAELGKRLSESEKGACANLSKAEKALAKAQSEYYAVCDANRQFNLDCSAPAPADYTEANE